MWRTHSIYHIYLFWNMVLSVCITNNNKCVYYSMTIIYFYTQQLRDDFFFFSRSKLRERCKQKRNHPGVAVLVYSIHIWGRIKTKTRSREIFTLFIYIKSNGFAFKMIYYLCIYLIIHAHTDKILLALSYGRGKFTYAHAPLQVFIQWNIEIFLNISDIEPFPHQVCGTNFIACSTEFYQMLCYKCIYSAHASGSMVFFFCFSISYLTEFLRQAFCCVVCLWQTKIYKTYKSNWTFSSRSNSTNTKQVKSFQHIKSKTNPNKQRIQYRFPWY